MWHKLESACDYKYLVRHFCLAQINTIINLLKIVYSSSIFKFILIYASHLSAASEELLILLCSVVEKARYLLSKPFGSRWDLPSLMVFPNSAVLMNFSHIIFLLECKFHESNHFYIIKFMVILST